MKSNTAKNQATPFLRRAAIAALAAGIVAISVLSLTPGDALPAIDMWDKLEHALAYFTLAVTGAVAFPGRRRLARLGLGLLILGCFLEAMQTFVPGRVGAVDDAIANAIGIGLGLALAWVAEWRLRFG
jgi:VanZ family protein